VRILIHEWCCSGGFHAPDGIPAAADGRAAEAEAIAPEGRAMFEAVLHDAAKDRELAVSAMVDAVRPLPLPDGVRPLSVPPGREIAVLVEEAARADATLVIAPETDGILARRVEAVRAAGGRALAPAAGFIAVASDKQATAHALAAAGVPVPAGRSLAAGEAWPRGFRLPAVRKARASVGCDGLLFVRDGCPPPRAANGETRLEAFVPGTPVGVSCLCGAGGVHPLPPVLQRFSPGDPPTYLGGSLPIPPNLAARAESLARRAIAALVRAAGTASGPAIGWVGVDMVLGDRDDGRDDRVLEVNPRLTTSFVGLARAHRSSLVRALIDVADQRPPTLVADHRPDDAPIHFDAAGGTRTGTQPA
jgi:predicted ATP-grasp superfamily ATP-dependent carboligase